MLTFALVLGVLPLTHSASVSSSAAQAFLGVGGSGAWWPMDLYHFPEATRQNLSDLLFSQAGLGLSSYRWNVGSGGVNVSNPVRAPETFYISPGVYNWSADAQGVYFLTEAAKRGVQDLTMFANSAPAPLTSGGTSCNSQFVSGTGAAYGTFLGDVALHFIQEGIKINYISPMNEPDNNFGPSPCGQEGMRVAPTQRAEVVEGLYNALSSRGLASSVGILADESSSLSLATNEYASWLPQVIDKVAALVHHTYDFPSDSSYRSYISTTSSRYPGKATWMSEICCSLGQANGNGRGWSGGYDPTINNALMFSGLMFQSFVLAQEPHYDFWTLVSNQLGCSPVTDPSCVLQPNSNGWTDGVIYYDGSYASNGNYNLYIAKHFWTLKHFGNFVKPGSQRRPIDNDASLNSMAVSTASTYYILAMNPNSASSTLNLTFPDAVCATTAWRTSASEDFVEVDAATQNGDEWILPLTAISLTTYIFDRNAC
ncbi:glycoside hydrolase [Desarmillaria tabescens]|uniref:Glycoside hydrolase n=1 Tax=Armillaria tabescens TaxID=1929756 RepID=A0AA39K6E3_ARMTA|nr:glycoside hydrolase [Desarmillaria tabescens]KAK0455350.1 glycoside hydrolase [Desarmillaria tabescens]